MRLRLIRVLSIVTMVTMMAAPVSAQPLASVPNASVASAVRDQGGPPDLQAATDITPIRTTHGGLTDRQIKDKYSALGDQDVIILVQLSAPDVVNYQGGIAGMAATAATNGQQFNAQTAAAQAYIAYLSTQQSAFVAEAQQVDASTDLLYKYAAALNGVALRVPASAVEKISQLAGVKAIFENTIAHLDTDRGPSWINAPAVWAALGGQGIAGEDVVFGDIDTGAWSPNPITPTLAYTAELPSFSDGAGVVGGAYAFPFTSVTGISYTDHLGVCKTVSPLPSDNTFVCNNKIIGGYWYSLGGSTRLITETYNSPLDVGGHGTHTASTAAGNAVTVTAGSTQLAISGVAPRARIIVYKACWEEDPNIADDGGCAFVDTTAAVNQAILDGVNVINFSIGGGTTVGGDTDAAFLNARIAGIFVSASAGNDGPTAGTAEHISPWVTSSAAMDHDRDFRSDLVLTSTYVISLPTNLEGASATGGYTGKIILAPVQNTESVEPSLCNDPYPSGTFTQGEIVVCRRGGDPRVEKGFNVLQGGAGGYVLVNASPNQGLALDAHWLPAVHLEFNATAFSQAGEDLVTYLKAAALASAVVTATIVGGAPVARAGDVMASFSSRGPTGINIIKPDVASPGTAIFAGYTPQTWENYDADGHYYEFLNGTSMASPHTAGAGILLKALHPTWTPVRIQSALMTGGVEIVKEDGVTAADPFDQGSGRLNLATSMQPGMVFDIPNADYTAVFSGTKDIETLNYPSMANTLCLGTCSWVRTGTSTLLASATYTWRTENVTPGLVVTLDQPSYTVGAGASQAFTVTANVGSLPNDGNYAFARVVLRDSVSGVEIVLPVAVVPSFGTVPTAVSFDVNRNAGSYPINDVTAIEITDLTVDSYGLVQADLTTEELIEDPTQANNAQVYDNIGVGSFYVTTTVAAGDIRYIAEVAASTSGDIDLYVGIDLDGDGPEASEELTNSATGAVLEYVNIDDPAPGVYWALVQNFDDGGTPDVTTLATAAVPNSDAGNMTVTGPSSQTALDPFNLRLYWDTPTMVEGDKWYGAFDLGSDSGNPGNISRTDVDITRLADDVTKTVNDSTAVPGQIVTYTITIDSNPLPEDVNYAITDTIPAGLTYITGSVTGGASVIGNVLTYTGTQIAPQAPYYVMQNSDDDPGICEAPFANSGAYVNLKAVSGSINPQSAIHGDTIAFTAFAADAPFNFWGVDYHGISFTDDGFAFFDSDPGEEPWLNQDIPSVDDPNNLMAMLWRDMEVVFQSGSKGVSIASTGATADDVAIIEYDDVQLFEDPTHTMDMEVAVWHTPDNTIFPEIIFAYDNISGTWGNVGTIGIENADGTEGVKYGFDDAAVGNITNGYAICFDWFTPDASPTVITYRAQVDAGTEGQTLTNNVQSTTDNPGSKLDTTSTDLYVSGSGVTITPATASKIAPDGATVTYTLTVKNIGNVTDTYTTTLDVTGAPFTTSISSPISVGPLAAGVTTTVEVTETLPISVADASSSVATVTLTSQADPLIFEDAVLTTSSGTYGVTRSPATASRVAAAGTTITYTVRVTNTGNLSDTFNVGIVVGGAGFTATAPSTVGPLNANQGTNVSIAVTVPPTATEGSSSAATVTFTSQANPAKSASSTLTTSAATYNVLATPNLATRKALPGTTITYTQRVTNTGTFTDTFTTGVLVTGGPFTTTVPPSVGPLAPNAGTNVNIQVQVPAGTADNISSTATVTFTSSANPAKNDSSALTTTTYTHGVTATPDTEAQTTLPGATITYTQRVTNTGNITDTFNIGVLVAGASFTTTAPGTVGPLAPDAGANVSVVVQVPANAGDAAVSTATITYTSQGNASALDTSMLTTSTHTHGVISTPPTDAKSAQQGATITYTLRVTNTGSITDTFNIGVLVSGASFTSTAASTVGPLAPNAGADVVVTVQVPGNAADNAVSTATVTFTSQGNASVSDSSALTTTADTHGVTVTPPTDSQTVVPGVTVTYTLMVTNTGTATDSFNVSVGVTGAAFVTNAPNTVGPLAAGTSTSIEVTVVVPSSPADASSSVATVTVTSQGNASVSDSSVLTTIVNWLRLYLPIILR